MKSVITLQDAELIIDLCEGNHVSSTEDDELIVSLNSSMCDLIRFIRETHPELDDRCSSLLDDENKKRALDISALDLL